jgi:putative polyketide hydroxylase
MELFRTWGVESRVRDGAMLVQPYTAISETLTGPRLDAIPFGYPTDEAVRAISPTTSCYCPQDQVEPVLVDHLRAVGGRIRFGTGLTHFDLDGDAVTAQLRDNATRHTWQIRARYLVGADGPRSGIRSRLGSGIDEFGTLGRFIAVTFRADLTRYLPQVPAAINAVQVAGAEGLLVPTSGDDRWIYARQCDVDEDSVLNWPSQRWVEVLRAATGVADLEPTVEQVLPFEMAGHVATAFRRGRAFIVGDAVHRTTPVGGSVRTPPYSPPTTWDGSSPGCCAASQATRCWTATSPNAGRSRPAVCCARCDGDLNHQRRESPRTWAFATARRSGLPTPGCSSAAAECRRSICSTPA